MGEGERTQGGEDDGTRNMRECKREREGEKGGYGRERRQEKEKPHHYSTGSFQFSLSKAKPQPLHQPNTSPTNPPFPERPPQPAQSREPTQLCPGPLTLHIEGDAVGEPLQLVVDHAGERLPVRLSARHQPVAADHRHRAVAVADLLELCLPFQLGVPGDGAGGFPVGGGAGGYQDLFCPARLGD